MFSMRFSLPDAILPVDARPSIPVGLFAVLALGGALGLSGCGDRRGEPAPTPNATAPAQSEQATRQHHGFESASESQAPGAPARSAAAALGDASTEAKLADPSRMKLIRRGQLQIEVADFKRAVESATRIASGEGGYVADSNSRRTDGGRLSGNLTLRVPAPRFAEAMSAFRGLGQVDSESVSAEDVTKAYTDLETRLRIKREAEARVREILKNRTARLSDVLEAERELSRLVEQIELMEGERRFYDQQIALATVTVALYEPEAIIRPSVLDPLRDALRQSLSILIASLAALLTLAIATLPWLVSLVLVWRGFRAWRRRSRP